MVYDRRISVLWFLTWVVLLVLTSSAHSSQKAPTQVEGILSSNSMLLQAGVPNPKEWALSPANAEKAKTTLIRLEKSIRVPMRDAVRLSTDLYFPHAEQGPHPVIVMRTPLQ